MGRKTVIKVNSWIPGLITDLADNANRGYTSFKNATVNALGKLEKRQGWLSLYGTFTSNLYQSTDFGYHMGLYPISSNLGSGRANYKMRPDMFHFGYSKFFPTWKQEPKSNMITIRPKASGNPAEPVSLVLNKLEYNDPGWDSTVDHYLTPIPGTPGPYVFSASTQGKMQFLQAGECIYIIDPGKSLRRVPINNYYENIRPDTKTTGTTGPIGSSADFLDRPWVFEKHPIARTVDLPGPVISENISISTKYLKSTDGQLYDLPSGKTVLWTENEFLNDPLGAAGTKYKYTVYYTLIPVYASGSVGSLDVRLNSGKRVILANKTAAGQCTFTASPAGEAYIPAHAFKLSVKDDTVQDPNVIGWELWRTKPININTTVIDGTVTYPNDYAPTTGTFNGKAINYYTQIGSDKFYKVGVFLKEQDTIQDGSGIFLKERITGEIFYDKLQSTDLIVDYEPLGLINECELGEYYNAPNSSVWVDKDTNIKPTCGMVADNCLWVNNTYDYANVYISMPNQYDTFIPDRVYGIETASPANPVTAFCKLGSSGFAFTRNSITIFRPTGNSEVPYVSQTITTAVGCDANVSITTLDNIAYFMFEGKLWSMDQAGSRMEIGSGNNTELAKATDTIMLKSNADDGSVRMLYPSGIAYGTYDNGVIPAIDSLDVEYMELIYYPRRKLWATESIERTKPYFTGGALNGKNEVVWREDSIDNVFMNYWYIPELSKEIAITKYGEIVTHITGAYYDSLYPDGLFRDIFPILRVEWDDCISNFTTQVPTKYAYGVVFEAIKPIFFDNRVLLNSIIISGNSTISYSLNADNAGYFNDQDITLDGAIGSEIPLGYQGTLFYWKVRHDDEVQVDITNWSIKFTTQNGASCLTHTQTGAW